MERAVALVEVPVPFLLVELSRGHDFLSLI
jgi:hypothetical protein